MPRLGAVWTAFAYRGLALELVRRFKFDGRSDALDVLLPELVERARPLGADVVVPIPRHRRRIRSEGCDPVHTLARLLARRLGRPLRADVIWRSRPTPPQAELGVIERRQNPVGSFAAAPAALEDRRVLLVDDVTTTGATLTAAADALWVSRPAKITPLALAGTPGL